MTVPDQSPDRPLIAVGSLWAGGAATMVVAVLVAVAGIIIARGIFDIPVLEPEGGGVWGDASAWWYAGVAALVALAATGLAYLLMRFTPQPTLFLGWTITLATVVAVVAPFASNAALESEIATGVINLAIGITIGILVAAVARSSTLTTSTGKQAGGS